MTIEYEPGMSSQPASVPAVTLGRRGSTVRRPVRPTNRLTVSYAADFYRRYPGELLHFYSRVEVSEPLAAGSLEISIPAGLHLRDARQVRGPVAARQAIRRVGESLYILWTLDETVEAGADFEFEIATQVKPADYDWTIDSSAVFTARSADGDEVINDEESLSIPVTTKGAYLRYLPALYMRDDLMGRFLMLFESFWAPLSDQIAHIDQYFDPAVAPPDFLPWLASWLDLVLDEDWPLARRRDLLKSARRLYEKRGTQIGLQEYLEIYTGAEVQIVEHKAQNFQIGRAVVLGAGSALGSNNSPHTFTVIVRLPGPRPGPDGAQTGDEAHWQRVLRQIIDNEKPAHTSYTLQIDWAPSE